MKSLVAFIITASALAGTSVLARSLIIDGTPVLENEHKAVFGIKSTRPTDDDQVIKDLCTGFLVHPKLIITAAHCLLGTTSVDLIANGNDIDRSKTQGTTAEATHFKSRPDYKNPTPEMTFPEQQRSSSSDIGYIILRDAITTITPLSVFVSDSREAMVKLKDKEVTLVGYGPTQFLTSGHYENSKVFVKYQGKKQVTTVRPGYLILEGEKSGALPGDSGGPEIAEVDGKTQVVALNHSMTRARKKIQVEKKVPDPDRPGKKMKVMVEEDVEDRDHYGVTVGTLLTTENLCWVEKDSGIQIPGVECK